MDRALKERLVGAIVLIVAAVLVVPVFLDGPADTTEQISERVTLPGQNEQPRQQQTIVLQRDRDQPVPVAPAEPAPAPVAAVAASEPEPADDPEPAPQKSKAAVEKVVESAPSEPAHVERPAPESAGLWAVQLGSFSNRENAEKLAADLRQGGYAAFLSALFTGSGELHRVRVGPQKDRESAEGVASRLASAGHSGQVVTHP